ncbi:N-terminal region of Chorein [Trypanosoma brucei equiperdum]|uniref:N-terminal region of Chorein n=1 Tax=Trypanosoma brucei equiperdum TaxID=630700 RepID=A0A3L6L2U9_9TRYP|nr:N-terminal region of Chorein [Trypanosoma brucei equiperdum]
MQHIISFLLARVAKVADVNPFDVESSLTKRSLRIRNVKLKKDALRDITQLPVESGHVTEIHFDIPWPSSKDALVVHAKEARLHLNTCSHLATSDTETELSSDIIRSGITEQSILGNRNCATSPCNSSRSHSRVSSSTASPKPIDHTKEHADAHDDEDECMSCCSEVSSSSTYVDPGGNEAVEGEEGIISYLYGVVKSTMSGLVDRKILVNVDVLTLMLSVGPNSNTRLEIVFRDLAVHVEPCACNGTEEIKVVKATVSDVTAKAFAGELCATFVTTDVAAVCVTSVFLRGVLCRQNVTISLEQRVSLLVNHDVLLALHAYLAASRSFLELPVYCHPHIHLRGSASLWNYAHCCVMELLRDRRRRYNFTLSHIRSFAEARRAYIQLLNYCHQVGDISGKLDAMVEIEQKVRYRDVILFLRRTVMETYARTSVTSDIASDGGKGRQLVDAIMLSIHVDIGEVYIYFPTGTVMLLGEITLVSRVDETNVHIGDVSLKDDSMWETLRLPGASDVPFFSFQKRKTKGACSLKVNVEPTRIALSTPRLLETIKPVASILPLLFVEMVATSRTAPAPSSRGTMEKMSFVLPFLRLIIDDINVECEKLSLIIIKGDAPRGSQIGVSLHALSAHFGEGAHELVAPINVRMGDEGNIIVSELKFNICPAFWEYLKHICSEWSEVAWVGYESYKGATKRRQRSSNANVSISSWEEIFTAADIHQVSRRKKKSQCICIKCIQCWFVPTESVITIGETRIFSSKNVSDEDVLCIHLRSFMLTTEDASKPFFIIDFPRGAKCRVASLSKGRLFCALASSSVVEVTLGVFSTQKLLSASNLQLGLSHPMSHFSVETVQVLDAVEVAPLRVSFCSRLHSALTHNFLPPVACVLISVGSVCVRVDRLTAGEFKQITSTMESCGALFVSPHAWREWCCAFPHNSCEIAIALCNTTCVLSFGESGVLQCRCRIPNAGSESALSFFNRFSEFFHELRDSPPALLINSCGAYTKELYIPAVDAEVLHPLLPSSCLKVEVRDLSASFLFRKEAMCVLGVHAEGGLTPLKLNVQSITMYGGDVISLKLEALKFVLASTASTQDARKYGAEATSVLSTFEKQALVELECIELKTNLCDTPYPVRQLFDALLDIRRMATSLSRKHVITADYLHDVSYNLDMIGSCFFNCPGKVVNVVECEFLAVRGSARLVVCRGTHVLFQRCRISTLIRSSIAVEDESGSFLLLDCDDTIKKLETHEATQLDAPNVRDILRCIVPHGLHLMIHHSRGELLFPTGCQLTFAFTLVGDCLCSTSYGLGLQLCLQNSWVDYIDGSVCSRVFSSTTSAVNVATRCKEHIGTVNATLQVDRVGVPMGLVETMQQLIGGTSCRKGFNGRSRTSPLLCYKRLKYLFGEGKWSIAVSAFPIDILLRGGASVAHMAVNKSLLRSKVEADGGEAHVDFRFGVQELTLWDFCSQSYKRALQRPLSVAAVARLLDSKHVACETLLSSLDLSVSIEQMKFIASSFLPGNFGRGLTVPPTVEVINQLGVSLVLDVDDGERVVVKERQTFYGNHLVFPRCIHSVDNCRISHFESYRDPNPEKELTDVLRRACVVTLTSGEKVRIVRQVLDHTLSQRVSFRTSFQISNRLPCGVVLGAIDSSVGKLEVPPGETLPVPIHLISRDDISLCLMSSNSACTSEQQLLSEGSLRILFKLAEERGDDSIGRLRKFVLGDVPVYIDVTYLLSGGVLTMFLSPARLGIHNGTRFNMKVLLLISDLVVEECIIEPSGTFFTLQHDPFGLRVDYVFESIVYSDIYFSTDRVEACFNEGSLRQRVLMRHREFPYKRFFELDIGQQDVGSCTAPSVCTVRPYGVFGLKNNSGTDVRFTTEVGKPTGLIRDGALSHATGRNFAYLPLHTRLVLHAGELSSVSFEVTEDFEERPLFCAPMSVKGTHLGQSHLFLMRSRVDRFGYFMELIPPLLFTNMDDLRDLQVRHVTRRGGLFTDELPHCFTVPAGGTVSYTALANDEVVNFAFAWSAKGSDTTVNIEFSAPVAVSLLPQTCSSAFIECGDTHHEIRVFKEDRFEPTVVSVSEPRPPYVTVVNLTSHNYETVPRMSVSSYTPHSLTSGEVVLVLREGVNSSRRFRVLLSHGTEVEIGNDVAAFIHQRKDTVGWVITLVTTYAISSLRSGLGALVGSAVIVETPVEEMMLRAGVKACGIGLLVEDGDNIPINCVVGRCESWLVYEHKRVTVQCTVSNMRSNGTYNGKMSHEIKPFSIDLTVRDARIVGNAILASSVYSHVTTLELELSDTFVYQMRRLGRRYKSSETNKDLENVVRVQRGMLSCWKLLKFMSVQLHFIKISDIFVLFTYDRSDRPPEDIIFKGSHVGNIFPSIHRAEITLPGTHRKDFHGASLANVWSACCEAVMMELLRQVPQLVSGAVVFPSFSSIQSVLNRIGAVIFSSNSKNIDASDTLLL